MEKKEFSLEAFIQRSNQMGQQSTTTMRNKPRQIEHSIQVGCVRWFQLQHQALAPLFFAVPNGGRRDQVTGAKLKAEGARAGVSDLILLVPRGRYHGLLIEMKTSQSGSRQSDSQKAFQAATTAQGYCYIVCRSVQDFIDQVTDYLNLSAL